MKSVLNETGRNSLAISPVGRRIAYVLNTNQLYVRGVGLPMRRTTRCLSTVSAHRRPIPGVEDERRAPSHLRSRPFLDLWYEPGPNQLVATPIMTTLTFGIDAPVNLPAQCLDTG
jgi:hypothetical protein